MSTNPADCDRTTVYTGECRNFTDTEWIRFDSGRRRSPDARDGHTWLVDVAYGSFWMADDKVRNLVHLVPARRVSSDDPATVQRVAHVLRDTVAVDWEKRAELILAAVAEQLNARGGCPNLTYWTIRDGQIVTDVTADDAECELAKVKRTCTELRSLIEGQKANVTEAQRERDEADRRTAEAEADRDRWKRHHDRVDGQWAKAEREVTRLTLALERVEAERDAAVERAEQAEREVGKWRTSTESAHSDFLQAAHDRDEARTRLREVCSIAAVSHDEVKQAMQGQWGGSFDAILAAVWALLSGSDPAVYVVRESEVAAVPLKHDRNGWDVGQTWYPPLSRGEVKDLLAKEKRAMVRTLAIARAIGVEAEQSVDPVEEKAEELMRVLASETEDRTWGILTEPAREDFRRLARHVLGQEADQ